MTTPAAWTAHIGLWFTTDSLQLLAADQLINRTELLIYSSGLLTYEVYNNMSSDSGSSLSAAEDQLDIVQRYHVLQAEQEGTQKRTFSNWINSQLSKHPQPSVVKDLFVDIQNGHVLLDLLEVLSGENLSREKGKNIFQARSNIESALNFLGSRSIKLINIHVEDIISGKPSIVLGLIWTIILHFQIEGLASILADTDDQQPVKCETKNGVSPTASPSPKRSAKSKWQTTARRALLQWARERCAQLESIDITDFKSSWRNGMAFLAIIQSLRPDLIDMDKLQGMSNDDKLNEAFRIAETELKIPKLIEPEDLNVSDPDEKSIMTYVAQFLQYSKNMEVPTKDISARVHKAMEWLNEQEQTLKTLFSEMKDETYTKKYQEILLFMRKFNEQKRIFMSGLAVESLQAGEQLLVKQSLENITFQIAEWKKQLDRSLPPPLDSIEMWLTEVENLMSQDLPESGSHRNTMSLLQALSKAFKALMVDAKNYMESLRSFRNVDDNGVVIVPTDKTEEMRTRLEKILAANFSVLVDYRCAGYNVLALLEEGSPKLKSWKVKYKSQESVEALLADYKEFVEGKQFLVLLDTAFEKFRELHNLLLTTDDYSGDPEISKQCEAIELKHRTFVSSAHDAESTMEHVLTSWTRFENNMNLITAWLDEQQRIAPSNVPMEILSKWKSVHKSLNRDGSFLNEKTYEKTASKITHQLKALNNRWTTYVKQYEEQKEVNGGSITKEDFGVDSTKGASKILDISAHSFILYIQSLQDSGVDPTTVDVYSEILRHLEVVETVVESVDNWSVKAEQLLRELDQKKNTQELSSVDIQDFYDNGVSCQEQLEKAEVNVQALTQLLHSQKDLQHFDFDRWRHSVVRAHERVQDLVSRVGLVLRPPEQCLSEEDVKRNFESSKSNLETYITKAMSLLGQNVTPEEFISQYETSLSKFGHQDLEHFLKATEHMKNISSSTKEKSLVEEVSADVRNRWKIVHDDLEAYVRELKMHIEKKKFDELLCKLDKQILKEKNNIGVVDMEELIREHEVVFSDLGYYGELNQCLQTMQTLGDTLRTSAAPTTFTASITECTKKKEGLHKNAVDIYLNLQSIMGKKKIDKRGVVSGNKGKKSHLKKSNGTQEVCQTDCVPQETNMAEGIESSVSTLETMLQRYNAQKSDLELLISNLRDRLVAESPGEVQDVKELQCKLHELQILLDQANQSWTEFEATSQKVEMLLHATEKKDVSEKRNALQISLRTVTEEIQSRIQALSITINVLLPIEEEVSLLCESSRPTPVHEVEEFTISSIGSIYQDLQDMQRTVKDQIEQCHILESAPEVVDPSSPVDVQAVQSVTHQYKIQLRATNEIMQEREALLKELEIFLSSVTATKLAIQAEATMLRNDRTSLLQKQNNLEKLQQKVYRLRRDAEQLDRRLQPAHIFLEDPECGGPTSCQKMLDGFLEKIEIVVQSTLLELRNLESRPVSGRQTLNGTLNNSLPTEYMVSGLTQEPGMEQFTVSKIDAILQEMKEVQNTCELEIQQLDRLDNTSTDPISKYKTVLQATNEAMKERETTLKSLGVFLSSLKATKLSIEAGFPVLGMDRTTLQEKQLNLESLEKDIYLLGQEAEKLDDCLQANGILLEDPENGGETSCKKMISGFFEKLERAQQAVQREIQNLQETEAIEQLNKRVKNFCKNIEDIQNQIDQVGLKDPTIHAVQQRMKSLIALEKKIETFDQENKSITDAFQRVLQISQRRDLTGCEECEELWEDTKQYLAHSKEQCEVIIELLRKFQHYRTTLTSLIQKAEATISHQSSYIGKENLQKMMIKVQEIKQEIEDQSENAEEINTICKKLHFQISKIKRFEDAPFQVEANTLIDKWLDVCEKLDNYNEDIKSAVCLWNRVLHLSQEVEPWTEGKIKFLESVNLTSEELRSLQTELQNQEKLLEEICTKSAQIQKLLQSDEFPFELQILKTSLVNKITVISTIVSEKSDNEDKKLVAAASDSQDSRSVAKELPQITGNEHINGELQVQTNKETFGMEVEPEAPAEDIQQSPTSTSMVEANRAEIQEDSQEEPQRDERSEALRLRLAELQKKRAKLSPDLQPRVQDNLKLLGGFKELLKESQDMMSELEDSKQLSPASPSIGHHGQCLEIKLLLETFLLEIQETMQILERRLEGQRQYESLSDALNDKMTSFYEELLNFSRSSRENAPCELKRQKLQALRDQYEGLWKDLDQVSQLAENVKQTSSSKGITRVQEAMDMHHSKMRGFVERIDHLKQVIEQPPIPEKPKGKKTKKTSKKKSARRSTEETSLEATMKGEEQAGDVSVVLPTEQTTLHPVADASVQDTTGPLVQHTVDLVALKSSVKNTMQPTRHLKQSSVEQTLPSTLENTTLFSLENSAQPIMEPLNHPAAETQEILVMGLSMQSVCVPSEQTALKPSVLATGKLSVQALEEPSMHARGEISGPSTVEQSLQLTGEPLVQHAEELSGQAINEPSATFTVEQSVEPTVEPLEQLKIEPADHLTGKPLVPLTVEPAGQPTIVQFTVEKSVQPTIEPPKQTTVEPIELLTVEPPKQLTVEPLEQLTTQPPEQLTVEPSKQPTSVQPIVEPLLKPTIKPMVQPIVEPSEQPTIELSVHPVIEPSVQSTVEDLVQPTVEPQVQPTGKPSVHFTVEELIQPSVEPLIQPSVEPWPQPTIDQSVQSTLDLQVQSTIEPSLQSTVEQSVKSTVEVEALEQPTAELLVHPIIDSSSQPTAELNSLQQPTVVPSVQPTAELTVQPTVKPLIQPSAESLVQPIVEPLIQPTVEPSVQLRVDLLVQPIGEPAVQPTVEPAVQPTVEPALQPAVEPAVQPTVEPAVQPTVEPAVQPAVEPAVQPAVEPAVQPAVEPAVQPAVEPAVQPTVEPAVQPAVELAVQPSVEPSEEPAVQPTIEPAVQPAVEPAVQPAVEPAVQPAVEPAVQPSVEPAVQPSVEPAVQPSVEPAVQPSVEPAVQPAVEPEVQPAVEPAMQHGVELAVQPSVELSVEPAVQPTVEPAVQPTVEQAVQPSVELAVQPSVELAVEPSVEPAVQPSVEPAVPPSVEPLVQPSVELAVQPSVEPAVQPLVEPAVQPSVEPAVQPSVEPAVQPSVEPAVQPSVEPLVQPTVEPAVQPTVEPAVQPTVEPAVQPTVEPLVQPTVEPSVQSPLEPPVQSRVEPLVQPTIEQPPNVMSSEEFTVEALNQYAVVSSSYPELAPLVPSVIEENAMGISMHPVKPTDKPFVQHIESLIQSIENQIEQNVEQISLVASTALPTVEGLFQSEEQSVMHPPVQPTNEHLVQPSQNSVVEPPAQVSLKTLLPLTEKPIFPNTMDLGVLPTVDHTSQDSLVDSIEEAARNAAKESVQFAKYSVQDPSVQPALEAVGRLTVDIHPTPVQPTDQLTLQPTDKPIDQSALNAKEKKSSKSKKKKKLAGKQSVESKEVKQPVISKQKRDTKRKSAECVDGKSIHQEHFVDVTVSSREAAEVKALEEAKAGQQEASGQQQTLLQDRNSYTRQLETSVNDLPVSDNDSHYTSGLITTVEERLRGAQALPDGGEKTEVQDSELVSDQQTLASDIPLSQPDELQTECEILLKEFQPHITAYQQEALEIFSNISFISGEELMREKSLEKLACKFKQLGYATEDAKNKSPKEFYLKDLKRKVKKLSNEPTKFSLMELEQEIKEIENLCNDFSKLQNKDVRSSEILPPDHKGLLKKLKVLKTEKQELHQEFMNFQNALSAARLSVQMLTKEKENLKISPTESHQSHLDKLKHFLDKLVHEKETLSILKAQQSNITRFRNLSKVKEEIDIDIRQLEAFWEQIELSIHREHDRVLKEAEELQFLQQKVDHLQIIIQIQQELLDQPTPSPEDIVKTSLLLSADVISIKHLFSYLKNACDLQSKRSWGANERQTLELSLDNLQSSLESFEERVKDRQVTRCQTPDALINQYLFLKPLLDSHIWIKKLQNNIALDQAIALLPSDVEQQITSTKKVHKEILDRQSTVNSVIEESKHISQGIDPAAFRDICSFFQQLQELYEEQIIQSVDRLQKLESGLEKRKALFSEIEKLKELLHCLEKEATPVKRGVFTAAELCEQLNCLKAKTTELEEIEGLVLTLLRNSQSYHRELKISEQLYLNDILRSLKSKARRIRRLEEKMFLRTEKLLRICNEFQERTTSLSRELSSLQPIESEMHDGAEKQDGECFEKKFQVSQNAISSSQVHLSEILRYKDLFEDSGLYWDDLTVDNLQNKYFPVDRSGHFGHYEPVKERYQELVEEAKVLCYSVQRQALAVGTHFDIIEAQVLCKKVKKISILATEALSLLLGKHDSQDALHYEETTIGALAENMDRLHQSLSHLITGFHTMEKSIQYRLEQTLCNLRKIHQGLQQPCVVNLDGYEIQEQLLSLEALDEICKCELNTARAISVQASTEEHLRQLNEIEDIGKQNENTIIQYIDTVKKHFNSLQALHQTIAKLAELFRQYEEKFKEKPIDVSNQEDHVDLLNTQQEEININIAEIQNLIKQLKYSCNPHDQEQLDGLVNQITGTNMLLMEMSERNQSALASYREKYLLFRCNKQKMCKDLEELETIVRDSFFQKPASYRAALAQWEKAKSMVTKVNSYEEELLKLRQATRDLSDVSGDDVLVFDKVLASLWDRWLYLLGVCRDWELYCDELKQEWKLISELMEREVILLDNCQEEIPDKPELKQKSAQLLNSVAEISRFEETVKMQQLQLSLMLHRLQNILGKPEVNAETEISTVIKEINAMEDKCNMLLQNSHKNMQEIHTELEDREALKGDISAVKQSLQQVSSKLENLDSAEPEITNVSLQEIQSEIESQKEAVQLVMEKVSARYAEHVPAELLSQAKECQEYMQEMDLEVKNKVLQNSPENVMKRKVDEIKSGLQSIEVHLTEKSQNIQQAKELQNKIWDEVDSWLSRLHALEAEVQEMAEEDPVQAHEWMDKLTEPLSHYQQVTHLVERRTANLNKAASKLEEYEDTLKSIQTWIQNTDTLLNEEMKDCSAKVLNKHAVALEIALDDSEQKQYLLDSIHSELSELATIFETESIVERISDISNKMLDLRERILKVLPEIQIITHEVLAIEEEVKKMERTINKIKTIMTSNDIDDMPPNDHYMHGQVMLDNIGHIKKTIAEIEVYRPMLSLSESGVQSLCVFRRMVVVLREAELLDKVIMEQNLLLEPIISEISELEKEHENAQQVSREESSDIKEKTEDMKKQMERLNQKKEAILLSQRNLVNEQLEHLRLEPDNQDLESILSPITEGMNTIQTEVQRRDSYVLPSLAEEMEDSTLVAEAEDFCTGLQPEHEVEATGVPPSSQEQLEDASKALADVQPKMILSDCQGKVTEVELWLQKVTLSPQGSAQDPDMLQSVEEQLAEYQKTLQETEMKINLLLEDADYRQQGNVMVLEEAEVLSQRLKALKTSLEHVQEMLQAKSMSEQIHNGVTEEKLLHPLPSRTADSAEKTHVLSTKGMKNKKQPTEITLPQETYIPSYPRSPAGDGPTTPTKSRSKTPLSVIEDITWSKWLYLQKELSYRMKATSFRHNTQPDASKEVKISFISRIPVSSVKSPLVEESKHFLTRLKALNEEASSPLNQESARNLHGALFVWMCSVSQWLQNIEEMLDLDILTREEAAAELTFYEKLTKDLRALSEEMGYNTSTLLSPITHEGAHTSILSQCYRDLRDWLIQIYNTTKTRSKCMQGELDKHNNYQNDIGQLYDALLKKKTNLIQRLSNREIGEEAGLIQEAVVYENELLSLENQVSSLNERGEKLSIPICSNQDIHKLEDVLDDIWHILRSHQDTCSSAAISKSQVEALLCGLSELLTLGKEKIAKSQKYCSRSKESLDSYIENHRKFFNHLENQVLLLQDISSRKPNPSLDKEHIEMVTREVETLRQCSDDNYTNMMVVMKNWNDFDSRYDFLKKKYEALEAMIPTSSLVEESAERVTERLKQYQKIQKHIDENESRLSQLVVSGKNLQSAVACPELDTRITKVEQQWSQLSKKVNHELHRLESLISHLTSYNKDSSELSTWLESARQKLSISRTQSLDASQKLDTIKNNLNNFFEFTNDVDQKSSLKTSVVNAGNQLLRLRESDTSVLKLSLAKFEESWMDLIGALPATQDKLQQQLVEKLPSLDAIKDLMDWMREDNEIRELQSLQNIPTTADDIRVLLQRYKGLRREMSHKQWIVDYANQSLLQFSVGDVESKRYVRTELAELLGTSTLQWKQLQGNIHSKIQLLEQALESISDQESRRQTISNWFDAQQQRLKKLHRPSSITAAERVLAECMVLEEQLKAKSDGIEELDANSTAAGGPNVFSEGGLTRETLLKKRDTVAKQVVELKKSSLSVLEHWKDYNESYGHIERMTVKLQYVLEQCTSPSTSMNSLNLQLKKLQAIQEEVEQHEEKWSRLQGSLSNLKSLCSQSAMDILEEERRDIRDRWTSAGNKLSEHLLAARSLLQMWKDYTGSCLDLAPHIEQVEEKCKQLLCAKLSEDREGDTLEQRIQYLKALEQNLQGLRAHNLQVSELSDKVLRQNPAATDVIQSERQNTSNRIEHLERKVSSKAAELMFIQREAESFKGDLDKLQSHITSSADVVSHVYHSEKEKEERSEVIKKHLLELSELTYDVERLNEKMFTLPLHDRTQMSLQNLNRMWAKTIATALEDCRQHRMIELEKNNFVQNYETWMLCLEKMEENLTEGIAGTFEALTRQQEIYERLQAEITINEHILPSFVNKALSILELEDEQNRNELMLKLTSLKEKWQSVIRLVQQRKKEINALLKQWWQFRVSKQSLEQQIRDIQDSVSSVSRQKCHSFINTEKLIYDFKDKERHLKRLQPSYFTTLRNCKNILSFSEPKSKEVLERELNQLQDLWRSTAQQLQGILTHFNGIAQKRHNFDGKIEGKRKSLHDLIRRVDEPLPTLHEELQIAKRPLKELEEALDEWGDSLKDLDDMKSELSQYIIAEDGIVLGNQVEALHRQWEELCLRVSMRKQEIEDRLNAWNIFNEKNKELCDWLTQMESKVLQTGDVNIEEMIEKLQKDCMEEINLFSENKLHLKQIGDQLIHASNQARSKEIENKLNKVNDRWKHLFDVIGSRVKKLKETLVTIQQLYKNMSNLRTWLARIESELSKPVIYSICDDQEINKKLEEQRDLQKDIEVHSPGVASVLNICERLLHDTDACANETECDSIQQTTRSLDKRWRNICSMSMERRMRIEETCRLWQKFLEDYSRFDEWLKEAEAMAASPDSSDVLYTKAKEEQKKFEAFQRQIHERLTHLELINKQYRRLARENRTDAASRLKQMVHEGNRRWDQLQKRVTSILRRLKHFTSQREDFEGTRDCILVWLTEMDLQLTNVEHFSESDIEEKMQQLIGFKQEITLNANKIDQLIVFGEQLIQKSEAMDAVVIEDELEEIHRYCQEVFGRVYRFHERLTSRNLNLEEERETSENDTDGEDSREIRNSSWPSTIPDVETSHPSLNHLMPPTLPHERSGRETPVSVDSIPLEWDPTVDVGGSSMHENEEEGAYYNPLSDVEIAESSEDYFKKTKKTVRASSGKSDLETLSWHSPDKHVSTAKMEFKEDNKSAQEAISSHSGDIDSRTLDSASEELEDKGLKGMKSPETHSGVIERWEIIHAQALSNEHSKKQSLHRWQQLNSDLDDITLWLDKTEVELEHAKSLKPSTTIQELEQKVKMLKDMLEAFDNYKARVISANLNSKEFQSEDEMESRDVLNRLHMVNMCWERACREQDTWKESLQSDLLHCEEFHERSHQLLLWLTEAEERRLKYRVTDSREDPHVLLESQKNLMQLKEQLVEKQTEANSLQDVSSNLLSSSSGAGYIEAEERIHVIGSKLRQLHINVSQDLAAIQKALDTSAADEVDSLISSTTYKQSAVGAASKDSTRTRKPQGNVQEEPKKRSFFYRVLRAAFPLQLLLLLLLFFACMIPVSEEDFSCAQANNFARSFYPMLRYTNGPPPT
ncbi:nesprin-2 isoform X3 [Hyla sarda]|uniref:nesprin-2 isoform X3 n=1 Tax=Hyla sarda TaxID=327740 RepID=UPI0024C36392|nr:nesprin-2 isoform X3 [Hyla sarda]